MSEKDVKKCPKCGGIMNEDKLLPASTIGGFWNAKRILPYVCRECGYIEFYKEMQGEEQKGGVKA